MTILGPILFAVSALALTGAAWRAASALVPHGLDRLMVVAVLVTTAAVIDSLALGTVGLGTSPAALLPAAIATWLLATLVLPKPAAAHIVLRDWWTSLQRWERMAVGTGAGLVCFATAWILGHPALGTDGVRYHLPEVVAWVHSGRPGSAVNAWHPFPTSSYPLTNEVVLAWGTGLSRNFAFAVLWSPTLFVLLGAAVWAGLRHIGLDAPKAALATTALLCTPVLVGQLNQVGTDLPAMVWLACCASLCIAARKRPPLLAPAVLAAALAIGTKATPGPLAIIFLLAVAVFHRRRLRPHVPILIAAILAGATTGGTWYLRDAIQHGSPTWPFFAVPWGDPAPPVYGILPSFMSRIGPSISRYGHLYIQSLAGALLLIAGSFAAPAMVRRKAVIAASALALLGVLLWSLAPATGVSTNALFGIVAPYTTRYLLPALVPVTLALGLAARGRSRSTKAVTLLFGAALGWSLVEDWQLGFPTTPPAYVVLLGAAAGAAVAAIPVNITTSPKRVGPGIEAKLLPLTVVVALTATLFVGGRHLVARHATATGPRLPPGGVDNPDAALSAFLASQPAFTSGRATIVMNGVLAGDLAGDHLQHRLQLLDVEAPCAEMTALASDHWLIINAEEVGGPGVPRIIKSPAAACMRALQPTWIVGPFSIYAPPMTAAQ